MRKFKVKDRVEIIQEGESLGLGTIILDVNASFVVALDNGQENLFHPNEMRWVGVWDNK